MKKLNYSEKQELVFAVLEQLEQVRKLILETLETDDEEMTDACEEQAKSGTENVPYEIAESWTTITELWSWLWEQ